jgi:hypothetical protein
MGRGIVGGLPNGSDSANLGAFLREGSSCAFAHYRVIFAQRNAFDNSYLSTVLRVNCGQRRFS